LSLTPDDVARLRAATPACDRLLHFDNAGASLMPDPVYRAVTTHLALERELGGYAAAEQAAPLLGDAYRAVGTLLGAAPGEIAFTENATRAWNLVLHALPLKPGDRILTHVSEYGSNQMAFINLARQRGVEIDFAPSDEHGQVDVGALEKMIAPTTRVIALTHVPMHDGLINPAAEVGRVSRAHGLIFLLDICQSVGHLEVDVKRIGCDAATGTGRKFLRGPRGTGFLYVSSDISDRLEPPFVDMRSAAWTAPDDFKLAPGALRFESAESNIAGRIGLGAAATYACDIGITNIEARVISLAAELRRTLANVKGVVVRDQGDRQSGIVTFTKNGVSAEVIAGELKQQRINITHLSQSQALTDMARRGLHGLARASVHYFNTGEEIARFCEAVAKT
jgi:cysteine desulfurase/selenocysteine lyase